MEVSRPYYLCGHCHRGQFPADAELDIAQTEYSPGVRRMQAVVGQQAPFDHGRRQLELLAGLELTAKAVERTAEGIEEDIAAREQSEIQRAMQLELPLVVGEPVPILYIEMDGTEIPVVRKETAGRAGKRKGEAAHTREAKLGCVFTQTKWDEEGYPIRDADSTSYSGAMETADEFGKRMYVEAGKRGWSRARKKVVLGDGAAWIWNLAQQQFPGAIQIVDLYHARQHLWDLARQLHPNDKAQQRCWITIHQDHLDQGRMEELVCSLRSIECSSPQLAEEFRDEANYFEKNAKRMRYPEFRRHGDFSELPSVWDQKAELEWLVDGLIASGSVTLIAAESGTGKTWLALAIAGPVAHGQVFAGRSVRQRKVLYLDNENPLFAVKERLSELGVEETQDLKVWGGWVDAPVPGPQNPFTLQFAREHRGLVVVDPLVAFHTGSEQDATDTRTFMQYLRTLANLGATVLLLHHSGKAVTSRRA